MKRVFSTRYAAREVGISLITLQRWIAQGKAQSPKLRIIDGRATRIWGSEDLARLRRVKKTTYRRGRGRKKGGKK